LIENDRPKAPQMVAKFLNMPPDLAKELMPKLEYDMYWRDETLDAIQDSEQLLQKQGKMKGPFDYQGYIYIDLLKKVRPQSVTLSKLMLG